MRRPSVRPPVVACGSGRPCSGSDPLSRRPRRSGPARTTRPPRCPYLRPYRRRRSAGTGLCARGRTGVRGSWRRRAGATAGRSAGPGAPPRPVRRPRRRQGHRARRGAAHPRGIRAAARGARRRTGHRRGPAARRRSADRGQDRDRGVRRHGAGPHPQSAQRGAHARRFQQRLGRRGRRRDGAAGHRDADRRLDDPARRVLRSGRIQAELRADPGRRGDPQRHRLRHPRLLRDGCGRCRAGGVGAGATDGAPDRGRG